TILVGSKPITVLMRVVKSTSRVSSAIIEILLEGATTWKICSPAWTSSGGGAAAVRCWAWAAAPPHRQAPKANALRHLGSNPADERNVENPRARLAGRESD